MIMKKEGLSEAHEVVECIFRSGAKRYEWMEDEKQAEERARGCLERRRIVAGRGQS